MFKKDNKADFRKHRQNNLGQSDFTELMQVGNPIVVATGENSRKENIRSILISPLSKVFEELLKHVQEAIRVVDTPQKKIIATITRYHVDKPDTTYMQIRLFMRNN